MTSVCKLLFFSQMLYSIHKIKALCSKKNNGQYHHCLQVLEGEKCRWHIQSRITWVLVKEWNSHETGLGKSLNTRGVAVRETRKGQR